jgi:hypothetical protein
MKLTISSMSLLLMTLKTFSIYMTSRAYFPKRGKSLTGIVKRENGRKISILTNAQDMIFIQTFHVNVRILLAALQKSH